MNGRKKQRPTGEYLRDLVWTLTHKEIKTRYKNSWLGYAWSVLNPLSFAVVYFVAFGLVMKVEVPQYPLFLLAGLLPWQWVSHSMSSAPNIFLVNATLVKKVRFPWNSLVMSTVLNDGAHFLLSSGDRSSGCFITDRRHPGSGCWVSRRWHWPSSCWFMVLL